MRRTLHVAVTIHDKNDKLLAAYLVEIAKSLKQGVSNGSLSNPDEGTTLGWYVKDEFSRDE